MRLALFLLLLCLSLFVKHELVVAAASLDAIEPYCVTTSIAETDGLKAELTYKSQRLPHVFDADFYVDPHVRIIQRGKVLFDGDIGDNQCQFIGLEGPEICSPLESAEESVERASENLKKALASMDDLAIKLDALEQNLELDKNSMSNLKTKPGREKNVEIDKDLSTNADSFLQKLEILDKFSGTIKKNIEELRSALDKAKDPISSQPDVSHIANELSAQIRQTNQALEGLKPGSDLSAIQEHLHVIGVTIISLCQDFDQMRQSLVPARRAYDKQVAAKVLLESQSQPLLPAVRLNVSCWKAESYSLTFCYDPASHRYVPNKGTSLCAFNPPVKVIRQEKVKDLNTKLCFFKKDYSIDGEPIFEVNRGKESAQKFDINLGDNSVAYINGPVFLDLDYDGELEIYLEVASRGAYCCSHGKIYSYSPQKHQYKEFNFDWGNYRNAPSFRDIDGDGYIELINRDEDFSGEFGGYAISGLAPIRIQHYRRGKLIDVTRDFPKLIEEEADHWWKDYTVKQRNVDTILAAYVADMALLGKGHLAFKEALSQYQGEEDDKRKFITLLKKAAKRHGYNI